MQQCGDLVFFCGKMAAGKSTKATAYAAEHNAVLVAEDDWLTMLYPEQINAVADYLKYSALLKPLLQTHLTNILQTGVTVVMDFPANTKQQRQWFVELAQNAGASHQMFYLQASDEQCLKQLEQRRKEKPERAKFDNPETFHLITAFFEPPMSSENLNAELLLPEHTG